MRLRDSKESVLLALDTLRKNKLRSGLTILGICIGIATVILISSAINGLNTNIGEFVKSLGTNSLQVYRYEMWGRRPTTAEQNRPKLTYEDGLALRALPHVVASDPWISYQNFQFDLGLVSLKHGSHKVQNSIIDGSTTAIEHSTNFVVQEGRIWSDTEESRGARVVMLGHDAAEDLFPDESPIGKDVECEGGIFTVIGVFEPQPQPFGSGRNRNDNSALFPVPTFRHLHPELDDFHVTVTYDDPANKQIVTEEIRNLLRIRRGVRLQEDDNFAIFGPDSLMRLWNSLTGGLFLFMVAVSSVGLMVGGVGVMNIMLVSVTERTREIGIRKAIGATRNNILLQFTLEAITLCVVGGLLGILGGALLTLILHYAVSFLHAALSFAWVVIAFVVSCAIGLLFGIYPAWKAASMDPIEALRYE
jgi:putative ABC transport system permease protein